MFPRSKELFALKVAPPVKVMSRSAIRDRVCVPEAALIVEVLPETDELMLDGAELVLLVESVVTVTVCPPSVKLTPAPIVNVLNVGLTPLANEKLPAPDIVILL